MGILAVNCFQPASCLYAQIATIALIAKSYAGRVAAGWRRAFSSGFVVGLTAPALLFAGLFETPLQARRTSVEGSWSRVGQHLRSAMAEHRSLGERRFRE